MKVLKTASVNAAIRTLSEDERRKVSAWLDHLQNWANDERLRTMSKATAYENTYALNTSDDLRIFFTLDSEQGTITVVDIAKPSRFETAGVKTE